MKIIKNILKFNIITFNFIILCWGVTSFNSYRELIFNYLMVPQNILVNKLFFLTLLSSYISSNSIFTFVLEFGRNINNYYYHILNFILTIVSMIINFKEYSSCENDCMGYLVDNKYNNFAKCSEYLPIFQLFICLCYIFLFFNNLYERNRGISIEDEFTEAFINERIISGRLNLNNESDEEDNDYSEMDL